MRPWPELAAESRADESRNYAHVFFRQSKHLCENAAEIEDRLRFFVDRQYLAIPHCDGSLQLNGVVRFSRRDICLIDFHLSTRKSLVGITAFALQALEPPVRGFNRFGLIFRLKIEINVGFILRVG